MPILQMFVVADPGFVFEKEAIGWGSGDSGILMLFILILWVILTKLYT